MSMAPELSDGGEGAYGPSVQNRPGIQRMPKRGAKQFMGMPWLGYREGSPTFFGGMRCR